MRAESNRLRALQIRATRQVQECQPHLSASISSNVTSGVVDEICTVSSVSATSSVLPSAAVHSFTSSTAPVAMLSAAPTDFVNFVWGPLSGMQFASQVAEAYEEVVFWRRNLFPIPANCSGRTFVNETTRLLAGFASGNPLETIAMKSIAIMSHLLLQKSHAKSTTHENKQHLQRRLGMWQTGDILGLLREARLIQKSLQKQPLRRDPDLVRCFTNLMLHGKVNAALRLITEQTRGGVLPLSQEVKMTLSQKHPSAEPVDPGALLSGCEPEFHPIRFAGITADTIRFSALHTHGAAGPSGGDAEQWRQMCCSFRETSVNLCDALATVARRLATEAIDPSHLEAFLANRLIPLDKCPGLRPIGIGEISRRIIGKAIVKHLKQDIQESSGPIQLCSGIEAGCEAAIHAMVSLFHSEENEALLLVDADNAFNRLNRSVALWNIHFVCPVLARFANNCYRSPSRLFVTGGLELSSSEGTTQGDPLSMPFYALSLVPLIRELNGSVKQVWYADDAQATGNLTALRWWWNTLVQRGPAYGYFVNAKKTVLVSKPHCVNAASTAFKDTGIIFEEGARDLGGAIGSEIFVKHFVTKKVEGLCSQLEILSQIADASPHAAHAAFVHGLRHRWLFLQRTIPGISSLFQPLEDTIRHKYIPALLGGQLVTDDERVLLSLPGRFGGFAVDNPVSSCERNYLASVCLTQQLTDDLVLQAQTLGVDDQKQREIKCRLHSDRVQKHKETVAMLTNTLPPERSRAMLCAQDKCASVLVTTLPLQKYGFALSKVEFRDQLLMRYKWPLMNLPLTCSCGSSFSLDHSQICHTGGFINMRHDELRDLLAAEMKETIKDVEVEPVLAPLTGEILQPRSAITTDDARSDIRARGFWCRQQNAYFDIRVFYPHASSYLRKDISSLYSSIEMTKKREYGDRILNVERGTFTPLVFASSGGMGLEASAALKNLALRTSEKRGESYSTTMRLLRCRVSFCLMRSAHVCLRGSRPKSRAMRGVDPAELVVREAHI